MGNTAQNVIDLLWDYLKKDPEHKDRRKTGWGTKTKTGLVACIKRISDEATAQTTWRQALSRWYYFAIANGWTDADHHDADGRGWITMTANALNASIDNLDERQTATVLHALRAFQLYGPSKVLCDSHEACPHFDGIEPLTAEEIDALCERLNYGVEQPKDEQQTQRCVYCGGDVPQDVAAEVPTVSDQEAWERISKYHTSGCEWVNTRAHRGDYEQPEEESQPEAHVCFSDARTWADGKRHCQKCDKPMERSQW